MAVKSGKSFKPRKDRKKHNSSKSKSDLQKIHNLDKLLSENESEIFNAQLKSSTQTNPLLNSLNDLAQKSINKPAHRKPQNQNINALLASIDRIGLENKPKEADNKTAKPTTIASKSTKEHDLANDIEI